MNQMLVCIALLKAKAFPISLFGLASPDIGTFVPTSKAYTPFAISICGQSVTLLLSLLHTVAQVATVLTVREDCTPKQLHASW